MSKFLLVVTYPSRLIKLDFSPSLIEELGKNRWRFLAAVQLLTSHLTLFRHSDTFSKRRRKFEKSIWRGGNVLLESLRGGELNIRAFSLHFSNAFKFGKRISFLFSNTWHFSIVKPWMFLATNQIKSGIIQPAMYFG